MLHSIKFNLIAAVMKLNLHHRLNRHRWPSLYWTLVLIFACVFFSPYLSKNVQAQSTAASAEKPDAADLYATALSQIDSLEFKQAVQTLRSIQARYPEFDRISSVQTRIAVLHEAEGAGNALSHYLSAIDSQDKGDIDGAINTLDFILSQYKQSSLRDDALYLKAYVQIMHRYDFEAARVTLARLESEFGVSAYKDSADYLDAIALEQMGDTDGAREALLALRERHTAVSLPFGFNLPEGNVLSRYWYDRADKRLTILEKHLQTVSTLRTKVVADDGAMRVNVNVDGVDLELQLTPSPITSQASWVDGVLQDALPPAAGVFVGSVVGDPDSWVRTVIMDDVIIGAANAFGNHYTLKQDSLTGTLDYYQPLKTARRSAKKRIDSTSTEIELMEDAIVAPFTAPRASTQKRTVPTNTTNAMRVVPISIVIDSAFDRYHGGNGLVTALNQLNVADGLYRQFGIALAVDEVQVFGDEDEDPIEVGPVSLEDYLQSFRSYRQSQRTFFNDSALTYLFTGKQRTDATLGLAWIDTLCRTDGYDVGIITPSVIGDVLLTHELGHSLGAQHDTDTSCNQNTSTLMWPHISTRTTTQFSSCSQTMVSGARDKTCLVDAIDLELQVRGSGNEVVFDLLNYDSSLAMNATLHIETSTPDLVTWPAGCRALTVTSGQCVIATLAPSEKRSLSFLTNATQSDNALITGQLEPSGTQDFVPANNTATYSLVSQMASSGHLSLSALEPEQVNTPPAAASGAGAGIAPMLLGLFWLVFRARCRSRRCVN